MRIVNRTMDVDSVKRPGWQFHELSWAHDRSASRRMQAKQSIWNPYSRLGLAGTDTRQTSGVLPRNQRVVLTHLPFKAMPPKAELSTTGTFKLRFSLHGIHASSHPNTEYISSSVVHERRHVVTI